MIVTPRARRDLDAIFRYIAGDRPRAAGEQIETLFATMVKIDSGDLKGQNVHISVYGAVQRWSSRPYWIYYRDRRATIEILRVYHQARRPIER